MKTISSCGLAVMALSVAMPGCANQTSSLGESASAALAVGAPEPTWTCVSGSFRGALSSTRVLRLDVFDSGTGSALVNGREELLLMRDVDAPFATFTVHGAAAVGEGGWYFTPSTFSGAPSLGMHLFAGSEPSPIRGGTGALDGVSHAFTCFEPGFERTYRYDLVTGKCHDRTGAVGMNDVPLSVVRETGNGECTVIAGQINDRDFRHIAPLMFWNLRGADLSAARLNFADLVAADFRGADLRTFSFGYSDIGGKVDAFTRTPDVELAGGDPCPDATASLFTCSR